MVPCPRSSTAPRLDGDLAEAAWQDVSGRALEAIEQIHPNYRDQWTGKADLSARVRALIAGEDLYLAIEVRDDRVLHEKDRSWWAGDSIEVFFDTDLQSEEQDTSYSNDDLQLFLLPFHPSLRWGVIARGPDAPYPDGGLRGIVVRSAVTREGTDRGYVVEARIPLWNLAPLRPDAAGHIGFDMAINDVDTPGRENAETYMTLSGRFELYSMPSRFGRLALGRHEAAATKPLSSASPLSSWGLAALGLVVVVLLALAARRTRRRMARRPRLKTTGSVCALLAAGAALCTFLPSILVVVDDAAARRRWSDALAQAEAAAEAALALDTGDVEARADHLLQLLSEGRAPIHPRYRYHFVPLDARARAGPASVHAPGPIRYDIRLEPGETRTFPLAAIEAPQRLRLDLDVPGPDPREPERQPPADIRLEFVSGAGVAAAPEERETRVVLDVGERAGDPLRALVIKNRLAFRALGIDALYGEDDTGTWRALPLAAVAPAGVPLDVWHDRPATHIARVPKNGAVTIRPQATAGHRLWLALGADGAYPRSAYGIDVATVRVHYAEGAPDEAVPIVNGRHLEDRLLAYARTGSDPESVALQWEDSVRRPVLYTLHQVRLDPTRRIERIEVRDLGVLESLRVAAATVGYRVAAPPAAASGVRLEERDHLTVDDQARRLWDGLVFAVRSPAGTTGASGPRQGARATVDLAYGGGARGALEVWMPRTSWAASLLRHRSAFFAVAALLIALAAVVAGGALLQRTRHLRVKMLVAVGAATVVPLLFLGISLTRILNERVESELEEATLADLRHMGQRVGAAKARARDLAGAARDMLALGGLEKFREDLTAQDAFLRLPEAAPPGPARLGNASVIDAVARSGLYYSPWDGLVALGVARTAAQRRCLVGLRSSALLGAPPTGEVKAVLYGPRGDPLAASGAIPAELQGTAGPARTRDRVERLTRRGEPLYEAQVALDGSAVAAAHTLLRDHGRVVGLLGVYRSRASTEGTKAAIFRTVLLSTLAALLLVVLAGGTLVDRVTHRMERVTSAARSIAQGDLGSRVPVEADDEVGRLAASFNTMADALGDRVSQLTDLHRGLQQLTTALDRAEVARAAADLLAKASGTKQVLLAAVDRATDRIETLHRIGGEGAPLGPRLPADGPARDAVELKRPVVREGALFLPLVAAGGTIGLAICSPVASRDGIDRAFLDATGRQIGIALENARLYHAAVTDEPTGLYTQAFFVRRLKEEVDRAAATGRSLSLLRIVLDDFRALARQHGAAGAARLVAETAGAIEAVLPRRDMLARGRTGELLVLLVESDENAARLHVDRIAASLQRHEFSSLRDQAKPTYTYRSVTYPKDGAAADILLDSLFEVTEAWDESATDAGPLLKVPEDLDVVLGKSATMRAALEVVARVAPTNATVLLSGETGTGKEVLADLIHANSARRGKPYVKVNCAAIPETLLEAELFGHERGAFTGAERRRIGRFETAHTGTLFLDEIGDLPLAMQAKMLRVLQDRRISRVGESASRPVDLRIIAASNRDLAEAVRRGAFREDLFHRLHVIELRVPPLRERREDVPDLIEQFRREFNRRHHLEIEAFAPDALDRLYRYPWPGNVRELKNVVERTLLLAAGPTVQSRELALPRGEEASPEAAAPIDGLTPRQERILRHARGAGGVTNGEVVKQEDVSSRTALRELQRLVERGLLVRVGRRRGAVYKPAASR